MTTTIAAARTLLIKEGYAVKDVATAIDSLIDAGLDTPVAEQSIRGYAAPGGVSDLVITRGGQAWVARQASGLQGEEHTLTAGVQEFAAGAWAPQESDGWEPLGAAFDPSGHEGWSWVLIAEQSIASTDDLTLEDFEVQTLREQIVSEQGASIEEITAALDEAGINYRVEHHGTLNASIHVGALTMSPCSLGQDGNGLGIDSHVEGVGHEWHEAVASAVERALKYAR